MSFNPELSKHTQRVIFYWKMTKSFCLQICFNNVYMEGFYHIWSEMSNSMQGIDATRKL